MPSMPSRQWSVDLATAIVVASAAVWLVLCGFVISRYAVVGAGLVIAPLLAWLLLEHSSARVLAVSLGGMVVLGSSSDLGPNKVIYAGIVLLCAAISGYRLIVDPPAYLRVFRPVLWWGLAVVAVLVLSYFASPAGSDFGTFGRQSIFYLLILLGPVVGLDSGRDLRSAVVYGMIGFIGVIAAAGFAADWLDRRGVTALPFGRFVLSSLVLPALAFGLALVMFLHAKALYARILWILPIICIPIAMLVTGTRTNLIIFLAILAVLGSARKARVPIGSMIVVLFVAGAIGATLFPVVASFAVADPAFLAQRVQAAVSAVSGAGDQSLTFRQQQTETALLMLNQSPLLGYGLGYTIPFTVDSPLLTVLRLGWVGAAVVVAFIAILSGAFLRGTRLYGPNPATTAWWGFLLVCIVNLLFGTPFEDRGFGYAVMLVTMGISAGFQGSRSSASEFAVDADLSRSAPSGKSLRYHSVE